jgi:peptide/nickel transport system ATP-binding protein
MSQAILTLRNLSVAVATSAAERSLFSGINLELRAGQLTAVVGPSGIGKTSLCLALIGWQRPNVQVAGGEVLLRGRLLLAARKQELQRLWGRDLLYIPQSSATALAPATRVVDQLIDAPGQTETDREGRRRLFRAAFDRLEIPGFDENRFPHQYSGGQVQRILLSHLFALRPSFVVVDEPTTALHPEMKTSVVAAIKERIVEIGASALIVSHELPFFNHLVDQTLDLGQYLNRPRQLEVRQVAAAPAQTSSRSAASLEVRGMTVSATNGRRLVSKISFKTEAGTCLSLVGPSGAGKTTILRTLLGQHGKAQGQILVGGRVLPLELKARTRTQKRWLEYVPQSVKLHLNPALTADFLLRRRLRQADRDPQEAAAILASVHLPAEYLVKRAGDLSGGECQRLGIALALASSPPVLLLDEVTASLDPTNAAAVADILAELRDRRVSTLVLVSHQPEIVRRLSDATIYLRDGALTDRLEDPVWEVAPCA